jgi:hypothetical protein
MLRFKRFYTIFTQLRMTSPLAATSMPDGFWEKYIESWKQALTPFVPYPVVTANKLACLNWQHLLYVSFVALEAAAQGEFKTDETNPEQLTCKEGILSLEPTVEGQATWTSTFGIENSSLACPAVSDTFAANQVEALKYMIASPDRKLLGILESAVEDWLDEKLAPDWNIYLELAEMGELSEESIHLLEKINRRLAVFRRKTIRSHLSNSKPSASAVPNGPKASYIRRQTRRRRLQNDSEPAVATAATTTSPAPQPNVEDSPEC